MSATHQPASPPAWQIWLAVGAATTLLIARKPWALTMPQLWAEDGSVFLAQNDQLGARALFTPFQGYLHLLPRLIAWTTSRVVDVGAWPLFYNGAALIITFLLFVRIASPRLKLPGKPWLVLVFALAPHTGEVLLNITNLQWLAAFFLIAQLFMSRPTSTAQRAADLLLAALVGLTGPFALLLLPLFVWRWWHDRNCDNLALLLVQCACAAAQAGFIVNESGAASTLAEPLHPLMLFAVLGSRLVAWPLLGPSVAEGASLSALAAIGVAAFGMVAAWSLRPGAMRPQRVQIIFALVVFAAAGAWRVRPDTWETANLANGDRYFFIPRVLLAWLLIGEFDARPRFVAWIARGLCLFAALLELPQHRLPAPPDYHWTQNCDPIRRGVAAKILTLPEGWTLEYPGRPPSR
jgi:hypothetical protein